MSFSNYLKKESQEGIYPPSPQHVFSAGRCLHCGTDDHSLPEEGEALADWEKPCPVDGSERQGSWSFGPGTIDSFSEDELEGLPSHAIF